MKKQQKVQRKPLRISFEKVRILGKPELVVGGASLSCIKHDSDATACHVDLD